MKQLILAILALMLAPVAAHANTIEFYGNLATGNNTSFYAPAQGIDTPWGTTVYSASAQLDPDGSVMTSSWTTPSGDTVTVTTPKKLYESASNQAWRHKAAIKATQNNPGMEIAEATGATTKLVSVFSPASGGSVMTTSWTDKDGMTHTVNTPPKEGEDPIEQAERHAVSVHALKSVYPPTKEKLPPTPQTGGTLKTSYVPHLSRGAMAA